MEVTGDTTGQGRRAEPSKVRRGPRVDGAEEEEAGGSVAQGQPQWRSRWRAAEWKWKRASCGILQGDLEGWDVRFRTLGSGLTQPPGQRVWRGQVLEGLRRVRPE